jgi:hypothetical protein
VPIGPWIVDFCSLNPRLAIEIDDTSHEFRDESLRTEYLESLGFPVLRFSNRQVAQDFPEVIGTIESWIAHLNATGRPPSDRVPLRPFGPPPPAGEEIPVSSPFGERNST